MMKQMYWIILLFLCTGVLRADNISGSDPNTASIESFYDSETGRQFLKETQEKAEQGDAQAQYQLADQYWLGWGVPQDYVMAISWYTKAAEQGFAQAQFSLAQMYANGEGIAQNLTEALKWYTKAAQQGNADAQTTLGYMYASGQGVDQNYTEAARWYTKAAEQGNADAQLMLGTLHVQGWGVPQDFAAAVTWYEKAAEQGLAEAQRNLGVMYANGDGVQQDLEKAVSLYLLAAQQGDPEAQYNLSVRYARGEGVVEDYVEAYTWTLLAGMNGYNVDANKAWLHDHMTTKQIAEAQQAAKELAPKVTQPIKPKQTAAAKKAKNEVAMALPPDKTTKMVPLAFPDASDADGMYRLEKFLSPTAGFSLVFPTAPERIVVKDNDESQVIHYQALSSDENTKYNLFLHLFKDKKILEDKFQKAYLQNYLAARQALNGKDKLLKKELLFNDSNAVMFRQLTFPDGVKTNHEGMCFFVDGNAVTLTCVNLSSSTPSPTFDEFIATFERVSNEPADQSPKADE
jgi:TPR repeat protein